MAGGACNPVTPDWDTGEHRIACPVCLQQPFYVIDPDCLPCNGTGTLTLGLAGLSYFPPESVALAITTALTEALEVGDDAFFLTTVLTLDTAGVLDLDSGNA